MYKYNKVVFVVILALASFEFSSYKMLKASSVELQI